jgi:hypothetical protein
MTNYENDILENLQGDTPKQKYNALRELIAIEQDYKDLVIKLKKVAQEPLINEKLNNFQIIISKL